MVVIWKQDYDNEPRHELEERPKHDVGVDRTGEKCIIVKSVNSGNCRLTHFLRVSNYMVLRLKNSMFLNYGTKDNWNYKISTGGTDTNKEVEEY